VDFLLSFLILGGLLAWYGVVPTIWLLTLPLLMAFAMATALAVGLWLSALNVRYRDVQYTIPFLIQLWFFATPIAYSPLIFPDWLRPYIGLNPMAGVAQAFRWALFGDQAGRFAFRMMSLSALIVAVLLGSGLAYFRRTEKSFADVI
jgi:lipopolysaccharide transport system permease protein